MARRSRSARQLGWDAAAIVAVMIVPRFFGRKFFLLPFHFLKVAAHPAGSEVHGRAQATVINHAATTLDEALPSRFIAVACPRLRQRERPRSGDQGLKGPAMTREGGLGSPEPATTQLTNGEPERQRASAGWEIVAQRPERLKGWVRISVAISITKRKRD